MKSVTKIKTYTILSIACLLLCLYTSSASAAVKHGFLSKKLDEYYSTIKCLANILDDLSSQADFNLLFVCCGVWIIHDWLGDLVLENCYEHNYYQINNLTEPFVQENCGDYPKDSISCKLFALTPITLLVLIFVLILSLSACAIFMCIRLRYYQRYFEYRKSQTFDSTGSEEMIDETSTPTMKKTKSQTFDSTGSEEIIDETSTPTMKKTKSQTFDSTGSEEMIYEASTPTLKKTTSIEI